MYLIAKWHQLEYGVSEVDRVTQQTAPAFDPVGLELWSTWIAGASLHIVPDQVRSNPPALIEFLINNKCTIAFMPTPICANMIDETWPDDRSKVALRVLTTGGDRLVRGPLPGSSFERLMRGSPATATSPAIDGLNFGNWCGPSEATIISTFFRVPPGYDHAPPIGRVVDNVRVYIVDKHMRPVPIGVPGDMYIGGSCLATGYLNRPELSHDKFRPDIFLNTEEELAQIAKDEEAAAAQKQATSSQTSTENATPALSTSSMKFIAPPPQLPPYPRFYDAGHQECNAHIYTRDTRYPTSKLKCRLSLWCLNVVYFLFPFL